MRFMFTRQNPADNILFGFKATDEVRRRFHLKLWNVYNFFVTYANLDGWIPQKGKKQAVNDKSVLDRWILARLNQTVQRVTDSLEEFDAYSASLEIEKFTDDLSLWYIRRSRGRVGPAAESEKDRDSFYATSCSVLGVLSRLLAPFTPFLSDIIYSNITKEESVHLTDWPSSGKTTEAQKKLTFEMEKARQVVEMAHAIRKDKAIPVRQPLSQLTVSGFQFSKEVAVLISEEVNVKKVISKVGKGELVINLDTKITKELKAEAEFRELVRKIQEERKNMGLNLTQKVNVRLPSLPENTKLTQWIKAKAQINSLTKGAFKVSKA